MEDARRWCWICKNSKVQVKLLLKWVRYDGNSVYNSYIWCLSQFILGGFKRDEWKILFRSFGDSCHRRITIWSSPCTNWLESDSVIVCVHWCGKVHHVDLVVKCFTDGQWPNQEYLVSWYAQVRGACPLTTQICRKIVFLTYKTS